MSELTTQFDLFLMLRIVEIQFVIWKVVCIIEFCGEPKIWSIWKS